VLNRYYGGNNDLISLGQLMYKMVTGHNLFNVSSGVSGTPQTKDSVKRYREEAYNDGRALLRSKYFAQIDRNVRHPGINRMIKTILDDDLWTQPSLEKVETVRELTRRLDSIC
jgi:hypothetical protein